MQRALGRLAAALLIAVLAGPDVVPASLPVAGARATSSAHSDGMAATPVRAASLHLAIAPAGVTMPAAAASPRVLIRFHPLLGGTVTEGPYHLPTAVRPPPTVLRV